MKRIIIIFFIFQTFIGFGQELEMGWSDASKAQQDSMNKIKAQHDSIFKSSAQKYVDNILGTDFVKKNIKFVGTYNAAFLIAVYEITTTKCPDGKNTFFIISKAWTPEVNQGLSNLNKENIIKNINGEQCNLYIGKERAKEIAANAGLDTSSKEFDISIGWFGPTWVINAPLLNMTKSNRFGEHMEINMIDGTFKKNQNGGKL
jgi:hypothetical protein